MDAVTGLLGADFAGQRDLGEQRGSVIAAAGMHGEQAGERGAELDSPVGEPLAQFVT